MLLVPYFQTQGLHHTKMETPGIERLATSTLSSIVIVICWVTRLIELNRLLSSLATCGNWVSYHMHHMLSGCGLLARKRDKILSLLLTMALLEVQFRIPWELLEGDLGL